MQTSVVRYVLVREDIPGPHPSDVLEALTRVIVGQREALELTILSLIAGGHLLLEGPPGVAKTLTCKAIASACAASFKRIQFTPDLFPSDIIGTRIFDQRTCEFRTLPGPVFTNVLLADEINRAPAHVQAALLEAMEEHSVTIASETHALPDPFVVLATMNPYDDEGTYPLSRAQCDRFLASVTLPYPNQEEEREILQRYAAVSSAIVSRNIVSLDDVRGWRQAASTIELSVELANTIVNIVVATRALETLPPAMHPYIDRGAGPRATIAIARLARARAWLYHRKQVQMEDIRAVALPALRRRIACTYQMEVDNVDPDDLTQQILALVMR